ncbi:MAG TPA: hypothetical protein PKB15_02485 [Acidimicrobiia bacterium]|nr:hypothetical protein [Acidimicrobiia bacterium]
MIKRLKWIALGYIVGVLTFDILKRFLDERYGDNKTYQSFTSALASVSDFQKSKSNLEVYIDAN